MRITASQRHTNETRIRAAMDRLLAGHVPADGNCDITTLARLTGIDRAAFYGTRPYAPLRQEFERRLRDLRTAGQALNPHQSQLAALKDTITKLTDRVARRDHTITELTEFRTRPCPGLPPSTKRSPDFALRSPPAPTSAPSRPPPDPGP